MLQAKSERIRHRILDGCYASFRPTRHPATPTHNKRQRDCCCVQARGGASPSLGHCKVRGECFSANSGLHVVSLQRRGGASQPVLLAPCRAVHLPTHHQPADNLASDGGSAAACTRKRSTAGAFPSLDQCECKGRAYDVEGIQYNGANWSLARSGALTSRLSRRHIGAPPTAASTQLRSPEPYVVSLACASQLGWVGWRFTPPF